MSLPMLHVIELTLQWQEWNSDTINLAKELDKPIFLSSGYSACHPYAARGTATCCSSTHWLEVSMSLPMLHVIELWKMV
jgi:hypothetical protein